jgi:hypothetical protein
MSTRSVIARKTETGFAGVYHHWDGYPSGLGTCLYQMRRHEFDGSTKGMLKVLIDDHPCGWSTLLGGRKAYANNPQTLTEDSAAGCGCEYAYVFDADGKTMRVLSSYCGNGSKMIGAFGSGDPESWWKEIAAVVLDDDAEPDWDKLIWE